MVWDTRQISHPKNKAAEQMISPSAILSALIDALGVGITNAVPTLALMLGIVILSAVLSTVSANLAGTSRAAENCVKLCTFTAIAGVALMI